MTDEELKSELNRLHDKLDRILTLLGAKHSSPKKSTERYSKPEKRAPLTSEEVTQLQEWFQQLFSRWMAGAELEVQNELEAADADTLRRFADANNLNITTKTSKVKALQLIAARFREKRQLMHGLTRPKSDVDR